MPISASPEWVILQQNAKNHPLGDEPGLFGALNGLSSALGQGFFEQSGGVGFDVLAHEQLFCDFAIAWGESNDRR